ncbi:MULTISPECIES: aminoglycoside phosphotransferase family protein [unclassified Nocardiopsis]|uniref:aminoglycoside phosphotransferase family protein n=1 Tax=Nocardiopsis TaxID=2013 RepID=UPI00387A9789
MTDVRQTHQPLLERLLPDTDPATLTVREGQFHRVVIAADRVVRLPRTPAAAARLPRSAALLRALLELDLPFRTPTPLDEGHDPAYLLLDRIPGEPLTELTDPGTAASVAEQYTALLSALAKAGADPRARAALPRAAPDQWRRFAADVRTELLPLMSPAGRRRADRELTALDALPHLTESVVHGDLGPENVLWENVHGRPHLSGVIDWDDVSLGDPAEDLAAIGAGHGPDLLDRILTLENRDGTRDRITTISGTFALQQALQAARDGDAEELADGLTGYR